MKNKAFNSSRRFGKKYHLGRSMIEMLGVLAIIGVLSIGGLYAYRQAMRSHRVNQWINFENVMLFTLKDLDIQELGQYTEKVCQALSSQEECQLQKDGKYHVSNISKTRYWWAVFSKITLERGIVSISYVEPWFCQKIVAVDHPNIYSLAVYTGTTNTYGTLRESTLKNQGKLDAAQKTALNAQCIKGGEAILYFEFYR